MEHKTGSTSILEQYPYLEEMHPAHLKYIRQPPILNSLDYLFDLIEDMDEEKRDKIFGMTYLGMRLSEPNYDAFKTKVYSLSRPIFDQFLIESIINYTLTHIFDWADETKFEDLIGEHMNRVEFFEKLKSDKSKMKEDDVTEAGIDTYLKMTGNVINDFPGKSKEWYKLYTYFCDCVVSKLYDQPISDLLP